MDPTILAALAGIIGAIIGAVLGGFIELVALQIEEQPPEIQLRWITYITVVSAEGARCNSLGQRPRKRATQ